jgi:hypothetical protein
MFQRLAPSFTWTSCPDQRTTRRKVAQRLPWMCRASLRSTSYRTYNFRGIDSFSRYAHPACIQRGSAFKTNMTGNLASLKNHEQFTELFELASKEQDQDKVGALFEEILRLLERQTAQLDRTAVDAKPHHTAASA